LPTNLGLFLAFVAGFCFLRFLNLTRYASQTWEGPRLIFWSGTAAGALLLAARVAALLILSTPIGIKIHSVCHNIAPWDFSGTIGVALLLGGILLPLAVNYLLPGDLAGYMASRSVGTRLHHLLYDLIGTGKAICITLSDRKVYAGFVIEAPRLTPQEKFFELLPLRSGYRDKDTLEITWTVDYTPLLRELVRRGSNLNGYNQEDFVVMVPFASVLTARVYDLRPAASAYFKPVPAAAPRLPDQPATLV
jgi:hypothetical protein